MTQTYFSNGKLLLTGEYLVLHGALALALPLRLGQSLTVETMQQESNRVFWNAFVPSGLWLTVQLQRDTLEIIDTNDPTKAGKLVAIFKALRELNPEAFSNDLSFTTRLDFNPNWGLGSSSTLIANLARWAKINPYALLKMTIGGSGYDIACATATAPIFYCLDLQTPVTQPAYFNPPFANQLFFVYQGQKQHSSKEVSSFNKRWQQFDFQADVEAVSNISRSLPKVKTLDEFRSMIDIHEDILARCLERKPIKAQFPDFNGSLKSLGAWGGDFLLAATNETYDYVKDYFHQKGMEVIFKSNDIVSNHLAEINHGTNLE